MTTRKLLGVLRWRWSWLMIGFLAGVLVGGLALALIPRTYSSQALILVEAETPSTETGPFSATDFVEQRLSTYVDLGRADSVHQEIRGLLGRDLNREQIESRVDFGATPGSMVMSVRGEGETAYSAQHLTSAAATAMATSVEGTSTDSIEVTTSLVQDATLPSRPVTPDPLVVLPAGMILGLAIPLLLALLTTPREGPLS